PMRIWLRPLTKMPALGPIFAANWVVFSFVIGGLLLDLLVVPLLLWRRTRPFAFVAAVLFNLINSVLFDIGIFPWLMLGALLLYFPPDVPRRFARAFMSSGEEDLDTEPSPVSERPSSPFLSTSQKLTVGLLAAYLAVQVILPLRHYLYPGNVS